MKKINLEEFLNTYSMNLSKSIIDTLYGNKQTLSIAESCTGGLLSYSLTRISGASNIFKGGIISYQNYAKTHILGVKKQTINSYTPYSNEVVDEMLNGIIGLLDSTFAIATSGIADGGAEIIKEDSNNPVGSVYVGFKKKGAESKIIKVVFKGNREEVQASASLYAMENFIKFLN